MSRPRKPVSPFRYFNSSLEIIRLAVLMYVRFALPLRNVEDLSVHASLHNHFNSERHIVDRQTFRTRRSAALAEWQSLAS